MNDRSETKQKKGGTPILTGISKIHISPDTGRLSIPVDNQFAKQIDISATIIEKSIKDVFSLGLAILYIFAESLPDPEKFDGQNVLQRIDALEKIGAADLEENTEIITLFAPWICRAIRLPEKDLLSITLQKPYIKALKVLSIQLEMEAKELLVLSAQIVQRMLTSISYLDLPQQQIYLAIQTQMNKLCNGSGSE